MNSAIALAPMRMHSLLGSPLVSVLLTSYNYEAYVSAAIESVQSQTYERWELIACDDGSQDASIEILRRHAKADPRVTVIGQRNSGHAAALNAAFSQASGEVVAILDCDDTWFPEKLELVVKAFRQNPDAGLVLHSLAVTDERGRILRRAFPASLQDGWLAPLLVQGERPSLAPASGLALRSEVAERVFPLPAQFRSWADSVLAERSGLLAVAHALTGPQGTYRQHSSNTTGVGGPLTRRSIVAGLEMTEQLLSARENFAATLGVSIDAHTCAEKHTTQLQLALALQEGRIPQSDLFRWLTPKQRTVWRLLFALPRRSANWIFRVWWGPLTWKKNTLRRLIGQLR